MEYIRLIWFFAVMVAFAAIYQAGSMSDVSKADVELFMAEFEKLVQDIDAFGIFLHNTTIALIMFIPGFGAVWGLFSAWSTGFAFAAISASTSGVEVVLPLPLELLFLTPFGLMEVCAYSLAISRSLILLVAIVKKQRRQPPLLLSPSPPPLSSHLKGTLIEIGVVVALLLIGGYVEFFLIEEHL